MLEVKQLSVRYGQHVALDNVSAHVSKGEICVVLGANGAGKSSFLSAIAGLVGTEPTSQIVINGKDISKIDAHQRVEAGIALVPEGRGIFGELTVLENLFLGAYTKRARAGAAQSLKLVLDLFPRLDERKGQLAQTMSGGEQQMVGIGRALMSMPEILMLDEPSLGLSPLLSKDLFKSLSIIAKQGFGVLLIEQNARLSLQTAHRGYLMETGRIAGENTAQKLLGDASVISAYLGGASTKETKTKKK